MKKLGQISLPQDHPQDYHRRLSVMLYQYLREIVDRINALIDSGGGHVIEDEGTPLTQRSTLNFTGSGVSVADSGGKTVVTISGGGGGGSSYFPGGW